MAGQPKTREMLAKIEAAGGAARLLERVAAGETIIRIADDVGVSRNIVSGLLNSTEHRDALRNARRSAASVLAEESLQIADESKPEFAQVDKLRVDTRRWAAGKWDRETFGEQRGTQVTINLGALHLDALRRMNADRATRALPEDTHAAFAAAQL